MMVSLRTRDVYKVMKVALGPDLAAALVPSLSAVSTVTPPLPSFFSLNRGRDGVTVDIAGRHGAKAADTSCFNASCMTSCTSLCIKGIMARVSGADSR